MQQLIQDGSACDYASPMQIPSYQTIFPGGDTSGVLNLEYRIPIFGPVTLTPFFDAGINRIIQASQLG